jgi:hypothetical protein
MFSILYTYKTSAKFIVSADDPFTVAVVLTKLKFYYVLNKDSIHGFSDRIRQERVFD